MLKNLKRTYNFLKKRSMQLPKERYTSLGKRRQTIDELKLILI